MWGLGVGAWTNHTQTGRISFCACMWRWVPFLHSVWCLCLLLWWRTFPTGTDYITLFLGSMVELASLLSKLGYMDCHHPSASICVCWALFGYFLLCWWSCLCGLYILSWRMWQSVQYRSFSHSVLLLLPHIWYFGWYIFRVEGSFLFFYSCMSLVFCWGLCWWSCCCAPLQLFTCCPYSYKLSSVYFCCRSYGSLEMEIANNKWKI